MTVITAPSFAAANASVINYPVVAWKTVAGPDTMSAGTAAAGFPASHLGNPRTDLRWQATGTSNVTITSMFDDEETIDYAAIARHNWGTGTVTVTVQANVSSSWTTVATAAVVPNDGPTLWRFNPVLAAGVRLQLTTISVVPYCAVLFSGRMTRLQRQVFVNHAPAPDAKVIDATEGRSLTGDFLGSVILGEHIATQVALSNLTSPWALAELRPFFGQRNPFFFAWRPNQYPDEVAYAAFPTGHNPRLTPARPNGMRDASFDMVGFV